MVAAVFNTQVLFNGFVDGMTIGLLAVALVLVYRTSKVINFAVSDIGLFGASLLALLVVHYHVPFWVALPLALVAGIVYSAVVELVVVRRLFTAPRVIVVVATVGVAAFSQAIITALPDVENRSARYPSAVASVWDDVAGLRISGAQATILLVVPIVAAALAWFLGGTAVGRAVRAAASNADLARLAGINPKLVSTLVWSIAGGVGTLSIMLSAAQDSTAGSLAALGPSTLAKALVAAVVARMTSFAVAVGAALGLGIAQALLVFNFPSQVGLFDVVLLVIALIAVWSMSRRSPGESTSLSFAPRPEPIPPVFERVWWARHLDRLAALALLGVAVTAAFVVHQPSRLVLYAMIAASAIIAASLTVLTGWSGLLSLGQMAFAAIGALIAAAFTRGLTVHLGIGSFEVVAVELYPVPFVVSIAIASAATAGLAALLGWGAIRVRGLLLAPITFVFALAAQQYLYRQPVLSGGTGGTVVFPRGSLLGLDLTDQRTYLLVVIGVLAVVTALLGVLRRSGVGRSAIAVRDHSGTAAGYTVSPPATKLRAFALAGALAGLGGALLAGTSQSIDIREATWLVYASVLLVAMVVVGGLGSNIGPILGALWVLGLPTFFGDNELVGLLTSSVGLLVVLLYLPGGLMQVVGAARTSLLRWAAGRHVGEQAPVSAVPPVVPPRIRPAANPDVTPLSAADLRVTFGGLTAVAGVDVSVGVGEIVGLIGANGAGKSTLMDAICGSVPSTGDVTLFDRDVTGWTPWRRARIGLGRTHQAATLFGELTVRETILVALEARGRTSMIATALQLPPARRSERAKRSDADEIISFLGLGRYAESQIRNLSTGTRRIVELAGLLAVDARLLCLDEPTAGVAQRETEAFGPLLVEIRRELDAAVLVIEHDMPLIMGISDRIVCLEAGSVIAEGAPDEVRADPAVIASYLGTDRRSIERSGGLRPTAPQT